MPLTPLDIPAGVFRNGTDLQASGRWRDANLVRWHEGAMRPVGGWRNRQTVSGDVDISNTCRGAHAWRDNSSARYLGIGTFDGLSVMTEGGTVYDITPAGFTSGRVSASANLGYGGGLFGDGYYGTPRVDASTVLDATTWSLDNWGEYLVGCSSDDRRLVEWQLNTGTPAAVISNAPTDNDGLMVTEERFLFALGAGGNPRKVAWSDREDNTTWTPAATNEAGDIELQTNGRILAGVRTRGQSLILTSEDAHTLTYQGPPFVFGMERVGTSCGIISGRAAASVDAGVIWMGKRSFFIYSGGAVSALPSEVGDYVFSDINASQLSLVHCVKNSSWGEVWWFYPSGSSTEIDRYVSYNYVTNTWMIGQLSRTACVDGGIFRFPLFFGADGNLYEHEVGYLYDGATPFAETGPIFIGAGENIVSATQLIPDEKTQGDVTATFKTRLHPNDTEREYGPISMANPTSVRFSGRQLRMRVDANVADDWRVGIMRLDLRAGGKR